MCQAFLIVAHNFTDQWALSVVGRGKSWICNGAKLNILLLLFSKDTAFWISPCCQIPSLKYRIGYLTVFRLQPVIWYFIWIEMLLRLNSKILCVQLTKAELPSSQRPWPKTLKGRFSVCQSVGNLTNSDFIWGNTPHQNTEHREREELKELLHIFSNIFLFLWLFSSKCKNLLSVCYMNLKPGNY